MLAELETGDPMAIQLKDITAVDNGAKFLNVDLHIHSYGASADVKDVTMTPQAIVESAIRQELSVIALTDHNSDANVAAAVEHARQYAGQLLVLPGVEVTTSHGHLLVYFAPEKIGDLGRFLAKLDLVGEKGAENTRTSKSMSDVIKEADTLGAICIAAHIDRDKTGFEMFAPGAPNWKRDIIQSVGLYGVECDDPANLGWYSAYDDPGSAGIERRKIYEGHSTRPGLEGRSQLAHIQGSDAHSMAQFETANPDKVWTRMKLTDLTWSAFKTALVDPDARVRATATIPKSVPRIRGMAVSGGFLNGEVIHFSNNLNCLIGGRGTGKSTAIRALAYAFGLFEGFCQFDNCPNTISVFCEDSNGIPYLFERAKGGDISVRAKEEGSITEVPANAFRVEYFGQGELAEIAKDPLNSPQLFQEFLDRHTTLADLVDKEVSLVNELRENSSRLVPLEASFAQLQSKRDALADVEKQLKIAEEGHLREIVGIQSKITSEKTIRTTIESVTQDYRTGLSLANFERNFDQLSATAGEVTGDPTSAKHLQEMKATLEATNALLKEEAKSINAKLSAKADELAKQTADLKANHIRLELDLASKIADLKTKGLAGNLSELEELLRQKASLGKEIAAVEQKQPELLTCREQRKQLSAQLADVRSEMTTRRKAQLTGINQNLAATINDYTVFVKYEDAGVIDEFFSFVQEKMTGSYFQDASAKVMCERITPFDLASWLLANDVDRIATASGISKEWAGQMVAKLRTWNTIFELEVLAKPPKPVIIVKTKTTPAKEIPVFQLSDGQRHTILLTIALLAESNIPLIIDQPEDDLDNAFIFSSIVATLRSVKEKRQVIVVTHNANIAVLGDAELILPMHRTDDYGQSVERGSIDKDATKLQVQNILEGGPEAFARRKVIYGH